MTFLPTTSLKDPGMRSLTTLGAGLLAAAALAAPAGAATLPTVQVTVEDAAIELSGEESLGSGPVRLRLSREGGEPRTVAVLELKEGKKASDIGPLGGLQDASRIERVGKLVAGATVRRGVSSAVSFEARARTYVVVDASDERQARAEFTPAATHSGATFGANDARVQLRDDEISIRPERYLPRRGVISIRNTGTRPHHALALRLKRGDTAADAIRKLKKGAEPVKVGTPYELTGLLSGGTRVDVETHLKRGRYVVASFYAGSGQNARPDIHRGLVASFRVR